MISRKLIFPGIIVMGLGGCGVESVGTAASVAKLQSDQAKQGESALSKVRSGIDAASRSAEERAERSETRRAN